MTHLKFIPEVLLDNLLYILDKVVLHIYNSLQKNCVRIVSFLDLCKTL